MDGIDAEKAQRLVRLWTIVGIVVFGFMTVVISAADGTLLWLAAVGAMLVAGVAVIVAVDRQLNPRRR